MIHENEEFTIEKQCIFRGRRYKARDNGSVMRLSESGKRKIIYDDIWTSEKRLRPQHEIWADIGYHHSLHRLKEPAA